VLRRLAKTKNANPNRHKRSSLLQAIMRFGDLDIYLLRTNKVEKQLVKISQSLMS
jgi:hypothetical protein